MLFYRVTLTPLSIKGRLLVITTTKMGLSSDETMDLALVLTPTVLMAAMNQNIRCCTKDQIIPEPPATKFVEGPKIHGMGMAIKIPSLENEATMML